MNQVLGYVFLTIYIFAVGTGSFLQKYVMNKVTPFQLEVISAMGMFAISVPALLIAQRSLDVPVREAPLSLLVGLLFSGGSFVYVLAVSRLPVNIAAPVSSVYIVVAVILSTLFLHEPLTITRGIGITLALIGVVLLSR